MGFLKPAVLGLLLSAPAFADSLKKSDAGCLHSGFPNAI